MVRNTLRCFFICQMLLNVCSILLISIITVKNMKIRPTPKNRPLFVCIRYELTKPMIVSAACGWLEKESRNHSSMYLLYPKPRAMANTTAKIGTNASRVGECRCRTCYASCCCEFYGKDKSFGNWEHEVFKRRDTFTVDAPNVNAYKSLNFFYVIFCKHVGCNSSVIYCANLMFISQFFR